MSIINGMHGQVTLTGQDELDFRDMRICMNMMNRTTRCEGGRLIIDGFVCLHCGSVEPETTCKQPAKWVKNSPPYLR